MRPSAPSTAGIRRAHLRGMQPGSTVRPLAGRRAWIITDGKAGMEVQARGVADALGVTYEMKTVAPRGVYRALAPWGPVAPAERMGEPGSAFGPPWPDIAIATGRASIPYVRRLRRLAGPATFTVVLQDPKTGPGTADLIWVPAHDRRRGTNVLTTLTSPHSFTGQRLADLRASPPPVIAALPAPAYRRRSGRQERRLPVHRRRRRPPAGIAHRAGQARCQLHDHALAPLASAPDSRRRSCHPRPAARAVGWHRGQPLPRLPGQRRRTRRDRRFGEHDRRGVRHRPTGMGIHTLGRQRKISPLS